MWQISAAQLVELRKAIKSYNAIVNRWQSSGRYDVVPSITNLTNEMEYITDNRSYRERVNQLRRSSSRVKKDASKVVMRKGVAVPKYMADEIKYTERMVNERKKRVRSRLMPDYETLKPVQRLTQLSNKNMMDIDAEEYPTDNLTYDALLREAYPNMPKRAQVYVDVWLDMNGDPEVARMIMEMAENDPEGFELLMESPDMEKEIEYIYPDTKEVFIGQHSGWEYNRSSALKGDHNTKMLGATRYWIGEYEDYKNGEGYFG